MKLTQSEAEDLRDELYEAIQNYLAEPIADIYLEDIEKILEDFTEPEEEEE